MFFNVCINDERRKKFWLRFASKISSFKVYGPLHTKSILKRDDRIAEYVDARFETVFSKRDVSAFILYIGDYMLIEFSNEGYAFYAYKIASSYKPSLNNRLNSVDDLRNSSMPLAIHSDNYYHYFNDANIQNAGLVQNEASVQISNSNSKLCIEDLCIDKAFLQRIINMVNLLSPGSSTEQSPNPAEAPVSQTDTTSPTVTEQSVQNSDNGNSANASGNQTTSTPDNSSTNSN